MAEHGDPAAIELQRNAFWKGGINLGDEFSFLRFIPAFGHAEVDTIGIGFNQGYATCLEATHHLPQHFPAPRGDPVCGFPVTKQGHPARAQVAIPRIHDEFHGRLHGVVLSRFATAHGSLVFQTHQGQPVHQVQEDS